MSSHNHTGLRATITPDGSHVHLTGRIWSETFPVSQLPDRITFYEGLRDRKGGVHAQHYAPTVKSLLAAQKIHAILNKPKEPTA